MAENTRLILRTEINEIFTKKALKVSPDTIKDILSISFSSTDTATLLLRGVKREIAGLYKDASTLINISLENNLQLYSDINTMRNYVSGLDEELLVTNPDTVMMEKIPLHRHINETLENFIRINTEFPLRLTTETSPEILKSEYEAKLSNIEFLRNNFYDTNYASNMWMVGKADEITPVNNRISSSDRVISGYISVENGQPSLQLNLVIRGVPLPMRKTITSVNRNQLEQITSYNYVFTYPQYLINNIELVQSIQYIEILNQGTARFFYGYTYDFSIDVEDAGYNTSANLNIINKFGRNIEL
jgi:hypothetical protein